MALTDDGCQAYWVSLRLPFRRSSPEKWVALNEEGGLASKREIHGDGVVLPKTTLA